MLNFIKREKIYILMFLFILSLSAQGYFKAGEPVSKSVSGMSDEKSFEEKGISGEKVKAFFESGKLSAAVFKFAIGLGLFIFILALLLNLFFLFRGEKINHVNRVPFKPVPWDIGDIVRAVIVIVFTAYIVGIIESFVFKRFNTGIALNYRMMINTFFVDAGAIMVMLYFVTVKYRQKIEALGLNISSFFKNIRLGISAYILMLPLLAVILVLSIWFLNLLGYSPPTQPVFEMFMEEKRNTALLLLTVFVTFLGPVAEEIFFRGFLYSALRKRFGFGSAVFFSAAFFSLLHTNMVGFLPIMALGVLLAYLYEFTGSLTASITVHVAHNSAIVAFMFFVKEAAAY
jgi:uncharacterized protein